MVEHTLGKGGVGSSILLGGTIFKVNSNHLLFFTSIDTQIDTQGGIMGSITKTKTGYRAIVRLGKYRNNPIQKCFQYHRDAMLFIRNQEALIIKGKKYSK